MPGQAALGQGSLWRPLLDVPRAAIADYARAHGLRYALYSQHTISSRAPEFVEWGNEFSRTIPMKAAFDRVPAQTIYFTCKGSAWTDFYVWNWVRMIREYGVTGIYLDGTFHPSGPCNSLSDARIYSCLGTQKHSRATGRGILK